MNYENPSPLVEADWLADHLDDPDVRIIDATFYLPNDERDAHEEYGYRHIPGAVYFNIDDVCDGGSNLPHMLPSPEKFSAKVCELGLGETDRIVIYDSAGGFMAACRVWWMFRVFGHSGVAVLNGGLPKWGKGKRPMNDDPVITKEGQFTAHFNDSLVKNLDQMMANLKNPEFQVIDARSAGRFAGIDHEPRPTEKRGHIPDSINLPFTALLDAKDNYTFKSGAEIKAAFEQAGVDFSRPIVASCGSGVTATVVAFALHLIGCRDVPVYDGSWAEWGDHPETPIGL